MLAMDQWNSIEVDMALVRVPSCLSHSLGMSVESRSDAKRARTISASPAERRTRILSLSKDLLSSMWPADRVVMGMRVCKRLHSVLESYATHAVLQRKSSTKMEANELATDDDVCKDIARFKKMEQFAVAAQQGGSIFINGLLKASEMGCCAALVRLNLSDNDLGVDGSRLLAQILPRCNKLRVLCVRQNNINKEAAPHVAAALEHCKALEKLDLGWNKLGDEGAVAIASGLKHCTELSHLTMSWNAIGNKGAHALGSMVLSCRATLRLVDLCGNEVGDVGMAPLAGALGQCPALTDLDLSSNAFGSSGATTIAINLAGHKLLQSVDLHSNRVRDAGGMALAGAVESWPALRLLNLSDMRLGQLGTPKVAEALGACAELRSLDLRGNGMGGDWAGAMAALQTGTKGGVAMAHVLSEHGIVECLQRQSQPAVKRMGEKGRDRRKRRRSEVSDRLDDGGQGKLVVV